MFALWLIPNALAVKKQQTPSDRKLLNSLDPSWIIPKWINVPGEVDKKGNRSLSGSSEESGIPSNSQDNNDGESSSEKKGSGNLDPKQLVMDDAAKGKSGKGSPEDELDASRGGASTPPPIASGSGSIAYSKWYPMCIFIDPSIKNGNELVKGQVDNAAACGVNLAVWAITIKSDYSNNPGEINSRQQSSCDIGNLLGVPQWSTQVANKWEDAPALMCDAWKDTPPVPDTDVAGCAQLCSSGGLGKGFLDGQKGGYGQGMASGGAVPSILKPNVGADVGTHEAIGHSEMCWPNFENKPGQIDAGLGIGTPGIGDGARLEIILDELYKLAHVDRISYPEVAAGPEGSGKLGSFNEIGCAQFRKNAYDNDGTWRYDPKQEYYYVPELEPENQWKLGEPLFGKGGPPPPSRPPLTFLKDPRPDPKEIVFKDNLKVEDLGKATPPEPIDDPRHKKNRPSDVLAEERNEQQKNILKNLSDKRELKPDSDDPPSKGIPDQGSQGVSDGSQLVFADTVKDPNGKDKDGNGNGTEKERKRVRTTSGGGGRGGGSALGGVYQSESSSESFSNDISQTDEVLTSRGTDSGVGYGSDDSTLTFDESAAGGFNLSGAGQGQRSGQSGTRTPASFENSSDGYGSGSSFGSDSSTSEEDDYSPGRPAEDREKNRNRRRYLRDKEPRPEAGSKDRVKSATQRLKD